MPKAYDYRKQLAQLTTRQFRAKRCSKMHVRMAGREPASDYSCVCCAMFLPFNPPCKTMFRVEGFRLFEFRGIVGFRALQSRVSGLGLLGWPLEPLVNIRI